MAGILERDNPIVTQIDKIGITGGVVKMENEQRVIKFRAWVKDAKVMEEVTMLGEEFLSFKTGGAWDREGCIIMQYTGLKDKQGTDIYEGDIVILPDTYTERILDDGTGPVEPFNHLVPVVYNFGSFGIEIKHTGDTFAHGFWSFEHILQESGDAPNNLEVIGTIHETPELLEAQSD
jgi:uncharacterized phage protein (TIGR01671 family)